jgi:hypothetical protein
VRVKDIRVKSKLNVSAIRTRMFVDAPDAAATSAVDQAQPVKSHHLSRHTLISRLWFFLRALLRRLPVNCH